MTPILYEKDEIDFTSQGLGSLVEIYDVEVEEQRNGLLQLTASYPVSGVRYADISVGRIILAKPNQRDDVHAFRIVSTELDISGYAVTIEADSITYDLTHNLVKHLNASGDGQAFMTALKNAVVNPSVFTFYSDIATSSTTSLNYVNPMEAIMGTTGSFLQIWGGELKRENRRVAMFNRRGRDNVATFRLGKNISGLKYSVDISSLVTRIIPTKSVQNDDQTTATLEGTPVDSQYINNYEQIYTLPLEFTDDTIKTVADLNAAAKGWFTKSANTGRDKPTVTIDIDVLSLQDSADYQDKLKNLESVSLTDTVTVYVPEYGVNVTAIVNELHYDPILDRVTKMTVGTAKQSFADSSRTQLSDLQDKIISVQNQADAVAVSANGKSTNYYGSVEPSHPQEGDLWYWADGDKSGVKQFVNGDWVDLVDSDTQEKIANAVTDAVTQANAHTDEVKQSLSTDIATAKSQAASQASTAESNAKSAATSQFTQAQNALSAAKTDLTNSIASEASARNQAVSAANSQAQTYANTAKTDALNALTEEVTNRQNAVSALDTKATNAVNQAKSDINDTINAISIGGRNLFLGTKDYSGNSNWYINGNLIEDVYQGLDAIQTGGAWGGPKYRNSALENQGVIQSVNDTFVMSAWVRNTGTTPISIYFYGDFVPTSNKNIAVLPANSGWVRINTKPFQFSQTSGLTGSIRFEPTTEATDGYVQQVGLKLEKGNKATDYTQAPEDVVLDYTTKDNQIKATITQYQETNDGLISKAQTDAITALGLVATKVSQTDYDTKTGDLTTKYTQVKQTVDSQATDIVDIKKTASSQSSKINSISSDVDGTKQSISDIETTQDSQSDKINQITSDVDGTKQSITDIKTKDGQQDTRMGNIETSVSGVKSDFSTYKTTNDGAVKTAQTTAQAAVDGLKTKVSQTDYNTKTGQLQADLTSTTQTANQAKTDIVSIKQKDSDQDAKMNTIVSDANGTKQTVSDLQTTQGKQSGSITTLQQRADGFDATVTKVKTKLNDLSQVNMVVNSEFSPDLAGWYIRGTQTLLSDGPNSSDVGFNKSGHVVLDTTNGTGTGNVNYTSMAYPVTPSSIISVSVELKASVSGTNPQIGFIYYDANMNAVAGQRGGVPVTTDYKLCKYTGTAIPATAKYVSFDILISNVYKAKYVMSQPMMVIGSTVGAYVQGQYNNNGATAKAQLTADNATLSINNYKTDANGRISKAQAGVEANANAITQKVSQTDYDKKTGDLTTAVSKAQTTADGLVTTVGNYQTSNDKRVKAAESAISQNADAIALKVAKTDYDNNNSQLNTRFTKVETTANGTATTVGKLQTAVNNLGQVNQLFNTEFSPDFLGWTTEYRWKNGIVSDDYSFLTKEIWKVNSSSIMDYIIGNGALIISEPLPYNQSSGSVAASAYIGNGYNGGVANDGVVTLRIFFYDVNKNEVGRSSGNTVVSSTSMTYVSDHMTPPDATAYVAIMLGYSGTKGVARISQPMLVFNSTSTGSYVPGNYNNNAALAQVKITADSISNFVRDSSGNISSDFQTALSKTSIITGSMLATSIQTQTATQITSALTDNNGKIISLINQDSSGVQIAGKNIVLDGNTTVTGDFYAKGGNFKNLNASNLTVGTLNGSQVNITNINANNIVSGAISGANLNINLNTGSVVFQKGRINSSDYTTDINIDQGYISTANGETRALLTQGKLQLIDQTLFSPQTNPYLEISNNSNIFNGWSALIKARDSLTVSINGYDNRGYDLPTYTETFVGLSIGKDGSGLMPTKIGGAEQGVIISGGVKYSTSAVNLTNYPYIYVGSDSKGISPNGDRIYLNGKAVHIPSAYNVTWSASANVYIASDGSLYRASSAKKYKQDIKHNVPLSDSKKLLEIPLSTWIDKRQYREKNDETRYFGMIAEDLRDAGLEYLVQYGDDNEVEGINYDRVALLLIPLVKELKERIEELESKGK